ncbi:MAG: hypothetical protein U5K37_07525 [Natrialbaceae archaeon]|nr:hypothetical protein [Natrialbaceae archaeon]
MVPAWLAQIHPRLGTPYRSIVLLGFPPILFIMGEALLEMAGFSVWRITHQPVISSIFLALILLFANMISGVALWRLPDRFPLRYEHSIYKLSMPVLKITAVSVAFFSSFFWLAMITELPEVVGVIVALILSGYVVYRYRVHSFKQKGIDLKERMASLDAHE